MKFKPLNDRVLIEPLEEEERTAGGVIIPDTAKEKPMQGRVIAVGPGQRNEAGEIQPLEVKAGDRVLFSKFSGTEVKMPEGEYLIVRESDVLAIIEGAAEEKGAKKKRAA
jgi:chaperonin GroES